MAIYFVDDNAQYFDAFHAVMSYLKWLGVYYYLQPIPLIGPVIRMIVAILFDIKDILAVAALLVAALANGLYVLMRSQEDEEGFGNAGDALYTTYKMLLLAEFDETGFAIGEFKTLIKLMFFASSLLGTIVVLNLLIARMSDSYERIQDEAEMERRRLQARIVQKYEILFNQKGGDPWLHIVQPIGKNIPKVEKTEWAGVLNDVKQKLDERIKDVNEETKQQIKQQNADMKQHINEETTKIKQQLDTLLELMNKQSSAPDDETFGFN